jgi:hypothetical protein
MLILVVIVAVPDAARVGQGDIERSRSHSF